jgi:hypothetical protein
MTSTDGDVPATSPMSGPAPAEILCASSPTQPPSGATTLPATPATPAASSALVSSADARSDSDETVRPGLLDLPPELIGMIFESCEDIHDVARLRKVCRQIVSNRARPSTLAFMLTTYPLAMTTEGVARLWKLAVNSKGLPGGEDVPLEQSIRRLVVENVMPADPLDMGGQDAPSDEAEFVYHQYVLRRKDQRCSAALGRLAGNAISHLKRLRILEYIDGFHESRPLAEDIPTSNPHPLTDLEGLQPRQHKEAVWKKKDQIYKPLDDDDDPAERDWARSRFSRMVHGALSDPHNTVPLAVNITTMSSPALFSGSATAAQQDPHKVAQWPRQNRLRTLEIAYLGHNMHDAYWMKEDLDCLCNKITGTAFQFKGLTELTIRGYSLHHGGSVNLGLLGKPKYLLDMLSLKKLRFSCVRIGVHGAKMIAGLADVELELEDVFWMKELLRQFDDGSSLLSVKVSGIHVLDHFEVESDDEEDEGSSDDEEEEGDAEEESDEELIDGDDGSSHNKENLGDEEEPKAFHHVYIVASDRNKARELALQYGPACMRRSQGLPADLKFVLSTDLAYYMSNGGECPFNGDNDLGHNWDL